MHRRRFLQVAGVASAGVVSGCGRRPTATPPLSAADWRALAAGLEGTILQPESAGYAGARLLFNARFDAVRPQAVAQCRSADDVREVLAFVRRFGLTVTPRSGGHGYA